jgi:hypothetical protein
MNLWKSGLNVAGIPVSIFSFRIWDFHGYENQIGQLASQ